MVRLAVLGTLLWLMTFVAVGCFGRRVDSVYVFRGERTIGLTSHRDTLPMPFLGAFDDGDTVWVATTRGWNANCDVDESSLQVCIALSPRKHSDNFQFRPDRIVVIVDEDTLKQIDSKTLRGDKGFSFVTSFVLPYWPVATDRAMDSLDVKIDLSQGFVRISTPWKMPVIHGKMSKRPVR